MNPKIWYRWIGLGGLVCLMALVGVTSRPGAATADQPEPQHASYTITRDDDGKTLTMNAGDSFLLKLGEDFNWTITSDARAVARRVPNVLVVRGAQGLYDVLRPGEADIAATGTPNCPPDKACPQLAVAFRIHLSVAGSFNYRATLPMLAADSTAAHLFAISGNVLAGPTCPVQRIPPDPACADRPVSGAEILVVNDAGGAVGDLRSAADGTFSIAVQPGSYTLKPQRVSGLLGTAPPQVVEVTAADVLVTIRYDTGIR